MTAHEYGTADGTPPPGIPGTPGPDPVHGSPAPTGWPYDRAGEVSIPAQKTADAVNGAVAADTTGADSTGGADAAGAAGAEKKPAVPGRDRYLDLLRSIALVRVVAYHLFGWAWLSVLFPSMGVMFALAGSLMARSLNRPALSVIKSRVRRLLPPLWVFSALMLGLLFVQGWSPGKDPDLGGHFWGPVSVFNYLVPIGAPPYP